MSRFCGQIMLFECLNCQACSSNGLNLVFKMLDCPDKECYMRSIFPDTSEIGKMSNSILFHTITPRVHAAITTA
jgi:hypothetical protein